jgi:hypothetical protein
MILQNWCIAVCKCIMWNVMLCLPGLVTVVLEGCVSSYAPPRSSAGQMQSRTVGMQRASHQCGTSCAPPVCWPTGISYHTLDMGMCWWIWQVLVLEEEHRQVWHLVCFCYRLDLRGCNTSHKIQYLIYIYILNYIHT